MAQKILFQYILFFTVIPNLAAHSQEIDSSMQHLLQTCADYIDDTDRLQCYDLWWSLAGASGGEATDQWDIQESINPIDDSKTVVLSNSSTEGRSNFGRSILLILRCRSNDTDLYINWGDYLGSDSPNVLIRVGSDEAETTRWNISTDNEATFYPFDAITFIRRLMTAETLVAQTTPYNENPTTAVWDLSGLSDAIRPLSLACEW